MDASPRSSKRRKLDTPTRKASTPLVKSTLRKPSGRLAGRTYVSANGDLETADDDGTTPSRRASRRVAGTPNGTVNRAVRKREVAEKSDVFDALDVFDDIDGALPPSRETPAPSPAPSQTASVKNLRKKHVLDAETTALRPSRKNAQIPATRSTASSRTVNGDSDHVVSATRKSSRTVVNGYRNEANTEAGAQEELASEAFSPTKRIKNTRAANGTHVTTARKLEPLVGKGSDRASQRATEQLDDNESLDQLQVDGVGENTPSKLRSTRKSIRSARVSSRTAIQDKDDEPNAVTPSRSSKQRASIPDSEDELGDHEPPSRGRNASDRRRVNRADHIGNGDHIISVFNDEQDYEVADNPDEGDVDGNSVLESVLDPTEPSPFNKPGLNQKTKDAPALLQANLTSGRELDLLKTIVLERINAQRPAPLVELHEQYKAVHQLIEHTVTAGEGNSMLLIGARGSGKTSLVNKVLSEVSKDNVDEYHVVRLNGFIHTDDKIALREIWRQLGKEMDIEEDGGPGKNYADTLTTLLALLSHPSEQTGEMTDQVAKAVIFIMDEFDLFATHPRQTLLYNLFDIAQSRKAPIAVLGLTTRIDVSNSLEKRVKSRFSHRYVHLSLAKTFTSFQEMCKSSLLIQPDQLSVEERSILSAAPTTTPSKKSKTPKKAITTTTTPDILTSWNANVSSLFASKIFLTMHLAPTYYRSKSVPQVLTSFLYPTATISSSSPSVNPTTLLQPKDSKLDLISSLSTLALALLIAAARLDIIHDSDTCNFNMAYDEYVTLASRARIQSAAGGASASGAVSKVWGKEVAKKEWEGLLELGLIMPVLLGGGIGTGGAGFAMVKCDVSLEEIGVVVGNDKGIERALERWCRQL